jgi:hypothetical protein
MRLSMDTHDAKRASCGVVQTTPTDAFLRHAATTA